MRNFYYNELNQRLVECTRNYDEGKNRYNNFSMMLCYNTLKDELSVSKDFRDFERRIHSCRSQLCNQWKAYMIDGKYKLADDCYCMYKEYTKFYVWLLDGKNRKEF